MSTLNNPGGREKIDEHQRKFKRMLKAARRVADAATSHNGTIWFELGNSNTYWNDKEVQNFCNRYQLDPVRIDGCRFGLRGKTEAIKKPWRVMTNNGDVYLKLHGMTCEGGHAHETCANSAVTAKTAFYPKLLALAVHVGYATHMLRRAAGSELMPAAAGCASRPSGGDSSLGGPPVCPKMPRETSATAGSSAGGPHRELNPLAKSPIGSFPGCIARKVNRKEFSDNPSATAAMNKEWENLRNAPRPNPKDKGKGVWAEDCVIEAGEARAQAKRAGKKAHFAQIVEMCYEKNSELPKGHAQRVFKGRAVLLGDNVKDETFNWAEFQELTSAPAQIEAVRALEALGLQTGYKVKRNDAHQAYLQAYLESDGDTITYVRLPKNRWPKSWAGKYRDPVVPLILALYGHPESGGHWEAHCVKQLIPLGYKAVPGWNSVFWHEQKKALLIVYVDDFALAAHEKDHDEMWKKIKAVIRMGDETEDGRFLGCNLTAFEAKAGDVFGLLQGQPEYYLRAKLGKRRQRHRRLLP